MTGRQSIFVTLIAATLFGPLACCCAWAKWTAASSPAATAHHVANAAPTPDDGASCPLCRANEHKSTAPVPTPAHRDAPAEKCPCCEARAVESQIAETPAPAVVVGDVLFAVLSPAADDFAAGRSAARLHVRISADDRQSFLTDFCHRLRC